MKFNKLCNHYLTESNDFMDGLDTYEKYQQPVYLCSRRIFNQVVHGEKSTAQLYLAGKNLAEWAEVERAFGRIPDDQLNDLIKTGITTLSNNIGFTYVACTMQYLTDNFTVSPSVTGKIRITKK